MSYIQGVHSMKIGTVMITAKEHATLKFPHFTIVSASAGSGKTYALATRIVRFLLDERIPSNDLSSILAMTFTNNAAAEMKQRVLRFLKSVALGVDDAMQNFIEETGSAPSELQKKAERLLEEIFARYDDFQIQTIDSFMVRVLRSSAVEFGFSPAFELMIESREILEEAFERMSRRIRSDSSEAVQFRKIIEMLEEQGKDKRYIWNPFASLEKSVIEFYRTLATLPEEFDWKDCSGEIDSVLRRFEKKVLEMNRIVVQSGCVVSKKYQQTIAEIERGRIRESIMKSFDGAVNKTGSGLKYKPTKQLLEPLESEIRDMQTEFIELDARQKFYPVMLALKMLEEELDSVKKERNRLGIEDLGKMMHEYIKKDMIPAVFILLGDRIHHYLIDEFQDTSPMQWESMKPLFDEATAKAGSLFIVGDMKQSIFGFRGADWRIMHKLIHEKHTFPSTENEVRSLDMNWRSGERIVEFNRMVFHDGVGNDPEFSEAGGISGLTQYEQKVLDKKKGTGYVEIRKHGKSDELPEREDILAIIDDCVKRGYDYGDLAILAQKNDTLIEASECLNRAGIPFISHSSLDMRKRKSTGEMIALLRFLDSNIDDLSFATFVFGDVFAAFLRRKGSVRRKDLDRIAVEAQMSNTYFYKTFRDSLPELWEECFAPLNRAAGYFPAYDLLCEAYRIFSVYEYLPEEEATLTKLLESVIRVEHAGASTLKGFLKITDERYNDEALWNIKVPKSGNAVTLMTFHKAKGLDYPVVIVMLYDNPFKRGADYFIDRRDDGVRLLKISSGDTKSSERLKALYDENTIIKQTDELNKFYVGLTRAEEEMYVISISGISKSTKEPEWSIPSAFLPANYEPPTDKPFVRVKPEREEKVIRALHHTKGSVRAIHEAGKVGFHEKLRGEIIHAVLEGIEFIDEAIESRVHGLMKEHERKLTILGDSHSIERTVLNALATPEIAEYFSTREGRVVWREQEFVSASGEIYRTDRVVIDTDCVTIIDFKTGGDESAEEYRKQVRRYMNLIAPLHGDKRIEGRIVYVDRKKVEEV